MAQIIGFLKIIQDGILPTHKKESISSTNFLFRIHTKYTSSALLITSILLFIQQLFADHLKCIRPSDEGTKLESQPLNQFCYTSGTYVTRNESDSFFKAGGDNLVSVTQFHQYFQWVPFILLLQGMTFHLPQLIWHKFVEGGKLASYCAVALPPSTTTTISGGEDGDEEANKGSQSPQLLPVSLPVAAIPFASTLHSGGNKQYFYGFVVCEILNICMVFVSILTTEWFLGGRFALMGPRWVAYLHRLRGIPEPNSSPQELRQYVEAVESGNPLEGAFPTRFTCHWDKPMTDLSYLVPCVLGENLTHQRIYLLLWLMYLLMLVFGISNLIYRLRVTKNPKMRIKLVQRHAIKRCVKRPGDLDQILLEMHVGDWFILKRILDNVNPDKFDFILNQIKEALVQSQSGGQRSESNPELSRNNGVTTNIIELQPINVVVPSA